MYRVSVKVFPQRRVIIRPYVKLQKRKGSKYIMSKKISLLILFGGMSSEHEVSCASAASVLEHIDEERYDIYTIGITKEGNWFLTGSPVVHINDGTWKNDNGNRRAFIVPDRELKGIFAETASGGWEMIPIDVVFPVMHGKNGEDGTIQGLLQIAGIPFVGSDAASSAASMDKAVTKAMVEKAGYVEQAKTYILGISEFEKQRRESTKRILEYFDEKLPVFVKPANAGSSVGISKVKSADELESALIKAFREDNKTLIEEAIEGREIEVAVLGNEKPCASCIGEIFAANEFYDYNAKYENAESRTGIVCDLEPEKEQEIRNTAVKVYEIMGCRGLARVDFFLEKEGRVVFNEINTLPGFTKISMYPKLWEETGIPYNELIDRLIELAAEQSKKTRI